MKFIVQKSKIIKGTIRVSGAKNAALKMIAASIIFNGRLELTNIPKITDVIKMVEILDNIGGSSQWKGNRLILDSTGVSKYKLPIRISKSLRSSVVFVGSLLAKFGKADLPFPGGCAIGERPITTHINALEQMGVRIIRKNDRYIFTKHKEPKKEIILTEKSVTSTENAILYAVGSNFSVTLSNVAAEPEINDLINLLNTAGARIKRLSLNKITVKKYIKLNSITYKVMGDRIEAGTWMVAGLLSAQKLLITGFDPKYLTIPIKIAKEHGAHIVVKKDNIIVKKSSLSKMNIITDVYPGFPTDLQSPFGLLATQSYGKSKIYENLFNDRLKYLDELKDMGADVEILSDKSAIISGPTELNGRNIESTDLRAGATMILAGMISNGITVINKAEIIDRGYEKVDDKLRKVGASITRR